MAQSAISCAAADPRGSTYRPSPASLTDSGQPASAWFQVLAYSGVPTESRTDPGIDALQCTASVVQPLPSIGVLWQRRKGAKLLLVVITRIISPASKLATARALSPATADSSLGTLLKLDTVHGNEMLNMLDWLRERQMWIERSLANRHLRGGTLMLYDVTSSYVEGKCCALAAFGYNRDRKRGKMQIVYGLLCAAAGCPVAVEVFPGNCADPSTLATQISKIRKRFNINNVALVGDRGMITSVRIREDLLPVALDWMSALRNVDIRKLFKDQKDGEIDTELCANELQPDQVAEIVSAEFPGERLLVCLTSIRAFAKSGRKNANSYCAPLKPSSPRSTTQRAATSQIPPTATAPLSGSDAKPTAAKSKSTSTSPSPTATCCGREISSESTTKLNSTAST